jgi:hypothetical protein
MNTIRIVIFLLGVLCLTAGAQDSAGRGGLLKMWMKKKQDAKRIEAQAAGVTTKLDVPYLTDGETAHNRDLADVIPVDTSCRTNGS